MSSVRKTFCATCYICGKPFKTYRSFSKHFQDRHPDSTVEHQKVKFFDQGVEINKPSPQLSKSTDREGYLSWLTGITEQINASLNPCLPGK